MPPIGGKMNIFKFLKTQKGKKEIIVIDICSGIGMTELAMKRALKKLFKKFGVLLKLHIEAICEIDAKAALAFEKMHGVVKNLHDVTKASFVGMYCDILSFTFPCTSLSPLGKRLGLAHESGSASSIIWELPRILGELKSLPKLIFMENVKQLVINKKYREDFDKLVSYLESVGYKVFYQVLDAKDYGCPQHRERVFIFACLDLDIFEFPKPIPLPYELKDILEKNVDEKYYLRSLKDYFIKHSLETNYAFRVFNPSYAKVAHTITTKSGSRISDNFIFETDVSNDSEIRFKEKALANYFLEDLKTKRIRKLTRKEVMTLMGFHEEEMSRLDYISDNQIFKIMGNGIVIPTLEMVFEKYFEEWIFGTSKHIEEKGDFKDESYKR